MNEDLSSRVRELEQELRAVNVTLNKLVNVCKNISVYVPQATQARNDLQSM
jgi:hypothetical protein